jgi:hypothetical protein
MRPIYDRMDDIEAILVPSNVKEYVVSMLSYA